MNRAFGLTVILIGVIAAIFYLRRDDAPKGAPDGGARPGVTSGVGSTNDGGRPRPKMRVVALTRMVPRYALSIPSADPREARRRFLHWLKQRGGTVTGQLPRDPRGAFEAAVPPGSFKQLLKDLGMGRGGLRLRSLPARPATGPSPIEIRVSIPAK